MTSVKIKLTMYEIMMAANIGVMRHVECIKLESKQRYGGDADLGWQMDIESALTECAMAKYKNVFWCKRHKDMPDVDDFEVRSSQRDDARLIIHKDDHDDRLYWLVTGKNGDYTIHGCIRGKDAKQDRFWTDPKTGRAAFFVPRSELSFPE